MIRIDIRKRDGLARTGILTCEGGPVPQVPFPAVLETETVFPALVDAAAECPAFCTCGICEDLHPPEPGPAGHHPPGA